MRKFWLPIALLTIAVLAGCGGDDAPSATTRGGGSVSASAPVSRTVAATSAPAASPSPLPAATSTNAEDPFSVAIQMTGAVPEPACPTTVPMPTLCIGWQSPSAEAGAERGIALFGVFSDGGAVLVLGRNPSGHWQYWQEGQNPYHLLGLPGDFQACASGDVLNVRSGPSTDSPVVTALADQTVMTAEEFVLTEPGDRSVHAFSGYGQGWYRISAPASGWVYSKYTEALSPTPETACSFHKNSSL